MKIVWLLTILLLILWADVAAQSLKRFVHTRPLMGSDFVITLYTQDSLQAKMATDAAFDRIDSLNHILSDYQSDSELNRLSATAGSNQKVAVSPDLWRVLTLSQQIAKMSKGAFDISIGPLSKLWRRAFRQREFPPIEKIEAAHTLVDYRKIKLYRRTQQVKLKQSGMRLDLGGIGKGYAAEQAYQVLKDRFGLTRALVDAGGDLVLGTAPPDKDGWEVLLEKRMKNGQSEQEILRLSSCAIATSGDTYRYLEHDGQRYSHLINPTTGMGMTDRRTVTVIAPRGSLADVWASTLSIYPIEKIPTRWFNRSRSPIFVQIVYQIHPNQAFEVFTLGNKQIHQQVNN